MKKVVCFISIALMLLAGTHTASAQYYFYDDGHYDSPVIYEIGGSLGIMNCLTDLGGKKGIGKKFIKDLNYGNTQFAGSIYANIMYKNAVALRVEGTFGQVKAYDSILKSVQSSVSGRYERNLSFRSDITEIAVTAELHPLFMFVNWENRNQDPPRLSPYLLGGIGYFSFNPQAKRGNSWIDLQPLRLEGQGFAEYPDRKVYDLKQICIPVGLGVKYELSQLFNIRAEAGYRILQTDYLDDAHNTYYADASLFQNYFSGAKLTNALLLNDRHYELNPSYVRTGEERANPKNNDGYFTVNLKIGFTFGRPRVRR